MSSGGRYATHVRMMVCSRHLAAAPAQRVACRSNRRRSSCQVRRPWAASRGSSTQDHLRFACHLCTIYGLPRNAVHFDWMLEGTPSWSDGGHPRKLPRCRQADGPYGQPPPQQQPLPAPPAAYGLPQQAYGGPMQPQPHGGTPGQFPPQVRTTVCCSTRGHAAAEC